MIRDVMVRLDGNEPDELRLSAANAIAKEFGSRIIGLFINELPLLVPDEGGSAAPAELLNRAREVGDEVEERIEQRLGELHKPVELRRYDILSDAAGEVAAREARTADAFVALRPNGAPREPANLIEQVLFGCGRHLVLVPEGIYGNLPFKHVMLAWNGSRESARALMEALPYMHRAEQTTVLVVTNEDREAEAVLGTDAIDHLAHHGIKANLAHVPIGKMSVGERLIAESLSRNANLLVMGGYGHSRFREWLLGGATSKLLHECPVPLLLAH
jgi:nucleotide-binding universal stress UspA family protein